MSIVVFENSLQVPFTAVYAFVVTTLLPLVDCSIILDKLVEKLEKHDRNASERGRFIKEEHERIINSLKEVQTALGRINGYKHEE